MSAPVKFTAENNGFDHALSQVRHVAGHGAEHQRESTGFGLDLLHHHEEVENFGKRVLPLVRELEAGLPASGPGSVPAHA